MRCGHKIPSEIAEGPGRRLEERRGIVPTGRSAVRSVAIADSRVAGAIGSLIACAGVVDAADGKVLRDSALDDSGKKSGNAGSGSDMAAAVAWLSERNATRHSIALPARAPRPCGTNPG